MKIKADFVTNSSSSSYILAFKTNELKDFKDFLKCFTHGIFTKESIKSVDDVKDHLHVNEEAAVDINDELEQEKTLIFVDVSDEMGYGLIECTRFNMNVVHRSGY